MQTVVLTIHLILALLLIGVVLLQKNEGAGLLSGGGNMQARGQATALTKFTWVLAIAFIMTSLGLTVLATQGMGTGSVLDRLMPPESSATSGSSTPSGADLLPPSLPAAPMAPPAAAPLAPPAPEGASPEAAAPATPAPAPAAPPAAEAPATDAPATEATAPSAPAQPAPAAN